jgi:hypothetical protein
MIPPVERNEIFGLIRPDIDAHTLGINAVARLIEACGIRVHVCDANVARAITNISSLEYSAIFKKWVVERKITRLGFSYRLDTRDAQKLFGKVYTMLKNSNLFKGRGGNLNQVYFSGLPEACERIQKEYDQKVVVFFGDETQIETVQKLGITRHFIPDEIARGSKYDDLRMSFAQDLIKTGDHQFVFPQTRLKYKNFGTKRDTLVERIAHNQRTGRLPLFRTHVGPYDPEYNEAKKLFKSWLHTLVGTGYLDILSIGSSQLSQSDFGTAWGDKPNGGGLPINSEQDLIEIWEQSRPMLVRTYAGTRNIPQLADIYERTINMAWHALSFWWFNRIDGRGSYSVLENLSQHIQTLRYVAKTGKPFEPNIPHHFSFRGGDDYTYVLSSYLAAKTAKLHGVRSLVLQIMLNTPKYTWGIQDLAKARALYKLVKELESPYFKIFLQPRAGLDFFSPDKEKAKAQLAAVTAMMDDIEPENLNSPDIIHVVSYCEAVHLATPEYINESIQITANALKEYRNQKKDGLLDNALDEQELEFRTLDLYTEVKKINRLIDDNIAMPYSPEGLYQVFQKGILTAPYLWECKDEFREAVKWKTNLVNGGVQVVDDKKKPVKPSTRVADIFSNSFKSDPIEAIPAPKL